MNKQSMKDVIGSKKCFKLKFAGKENIYKSKNKIKITYTCQNHIR